MKKLILFGTLFLAMTANAQDFFLLDSLKGMFGLKDPNGKVISSVRYYSDVEYPQFYEGLAKMFKFVPDKTLDSIALWGYINEQGKVIVPFKYLSAKNFRNGVASVTIKSRAKNSDPQLKEIMLINKTGKEYRLRSEYKNLEYFEEGIAPVSTSTRFCDGKWAFIDSLGREITPLKYDQVYPFSEGLAAVNIGAKACYGGKWGFIDKTGKEVIPLIYDHIEMIDGGYDLFGFQFGRAIVGIGDERFYIDKKGLKIKTFDINEEVTREEFKKHAEDPIRTTKNNKFGFRNKNGETIVPEKYDMAYPFIDGAKITQVKLINKWAYLNAEGKEITPFKYDHAEDFKFGCAIVSIGEYGKSIYGLIDSTGKEILGLGTYTFIYNFKNGMAVVSKNKKYGYIDNKGREILPCKYDRSDGFDSKVAFTILNGKEGFIDQTGNEVIPFGKYQKLKELNNGFFKFSVWEKDGLLNAQGNEIVPAKKYGFISPEFHEGLATVNGANNKKGYINEEGKEVIPCIYDRAGDFFNGKAKVKLYNRYFYIDKNGKEIVK